MNCFGDRTERLWIDSLNNHEPQSLSDYFFDSFRCQSYYTFCVNIGLEPWHLNTFLISQSRFVSRIKNVICRGE